MQRSEVAKSWFLNFRIENAILPVNDQNGKSYLIVKQLFMIFKIMSEYSKQAKCSKYFYLIVFQNINPKKMKKGIFLR